MAFVAVPWMLLPKPLILKKRHEALQKAKGGSVELALGYGAAAEEDGHHVPQVRQRSEMLRWLAASLGAERLALVSRRARATDTAENMAGTAAATTVTATASSSLERSWCTR